MSILVSRILRDVGPLKENKEGALFDIHLHAASE